MSSMYEFQSISHFKTQYSIKEIEKLAKERGIDNFEFYEDTRYKAKTKIMVGINFVESYGKYQFLQERELALLISEIIDKGDKCQMHLSNEFGENWGYVIYKGKINKLRMVLTEAEGDVTEEIKKELKQEAEGIDWGIGK